MPQRGVQSVSLRRFCFMAACVGLLVAGAPLVVTESLARGPDSVADVAEGLQDAVVNISTTQTLKGSAENTPSGPGPKGSPFEEFFDDFFDDEDKDGLPRKVSSLGSGFVIDPSGLVVTNNHVIEGADEIIINFTDGSKLKVVKILGHDPKTDLALLESGAEEAAQGHHLRRFLEDARGRLGDGDRQSVRPRRQRHRRHHLRHQARHQCRALRRLPANRRRHQSRQFGWPLVQHGRPGDRREHGHHLADRRLDRHRLRRALQQRYAGPRPAQAIWRDAARLARRACAERHRRDCREPRAAGAEGRARRQGLARQPGRHRGHSAERRNPEIRRPGHRQYAQPAARGRRHRHRQERRGRADAQGPGRRPDGNCRPAAGG